MAVFCHSTIRAVVKMASGSVGYVVLQYDCVCRKLCELERISGF